MKLQIKDSGAWRNVVAFEQDKLAEVKKAATFLMGIVGSERVSMRIAEGDTALAYCEKANNWQWRDVGGRN